MGETTVLKLPYPDDEDSPNGPDQLQELAEAVEAKLLEGIPAGLMAPWGKATAPTGWLLCDGTAVSRSTYARLFSAISTNYGEGNGTTTFNVPDLRGRAPVGVDGTAGRLSANDALGKSAGEEKHALTTGELASHSHTDGSLATDRSVWKPDPSQVFANEGNATFGFNGATAVKSWNDAGVAGIVGTTDPAGSGTAHNNMQPYLITQFMIKV